MTDGEVLGRVARAIRDGGPEERKEALRALNGAARFDVRR